MTDGFKNEDFVKNFDKSLVNVAKFFEDGLQGLFSDDDVKKFNEKPVEGSFDHDKKNKNLNNSRSSFLPNIYLQQFPSDFVKNSPYGSNSDKVKTNKPSNTVNPFSSSLIPVDIHKTDVGLELVADLPGFYDDEVSVELDNETKSLKIIAEKEEKVEEENIDDKKVEETVVQRSERRKSSRYERIITFDVKFDEEKTEASLERGVLTVKLPFDEKTAPKKITVNTKSF